MISLPGFPSPPSETPCHCSHPLLLFLLLRHVVVVEDFAQSIHCCVEPSSAGSTRSDIEYYNKIRKYKMISQDNMRR